MKQLRLATLLSLSPMAVMAQDMTGAGVTARPILPVRIEEHLQHVTLFRALEDLGCTIAEPNEAEYQTIHLAPGAGDGDFTAVR